MAIDVAPWLLRDYDPVGTYLKAFQTGASISAEQTRLAEQQRQANMDYMAKQEAMQQNILKAQVELQMEKAYREQRMSLENAQLEETKRRNDLVAAQAADEVKARMEQNAIMNSLRAAGMAETQRHNLAAETKAITHFGPNGEVTQFDPTTGQVKTLKPGTPKNEVSLSTIGQLLNSPTGTGFLEQNAGADVTPSMVSKFRSGLGLTNAPPQVQSTADPIALREEAKKAIAAGKDRKAVEDRFFKLTGQKL